jgi:hypothetical protein
MTIEIEIEFHVKPRRGDMMYQNQIKVKTSPQYNASVTARKEVCWWSCEASSNGNSTTPSGLGLRVNLVIL